MKKLNFDEMEMVQGGNFMDGFCTGTGIIGAGVGIAAAVSVLLITPPGEIALAIAGGVCLAYALW